MGNQKRVLKFYREALMLFRAQGDERSAGYALENIAKSFADLGDLGAPSSSIKRHSFRSVDRHARINRRKEIEPPMTNAGASTTHYRLPLRNAAPCCAGQGRLEAERQPRKEHAQGQERCKDCCQEAGQEHGESDVARCRGGRESAESKGAEILALIGRPKGAITAVLLPPARLRV